MKRLLTVLLMLALLPLQAAEPEDQTETNPEEEQAVDDPEGEDLAADEEAAIEGEPEPEEDEAIANLDGDNDFVPSVRISEDLSVSFPVDI